MPPPSIGVVAELGETTQFHMRGALIVDTSDPYPVIKGGSPMLLITATTEPTGAEFDVLRNGVVVDTVAIAFTGDYQEHQVEEVYVRGDLLVLDMTDDGSGGDGLVVNVEFRPSVT